MPLLRYRIGDRGSLATEGCSCGSPLPALASLAGRSNDFLVGRDGRLVHSLAPIYVLRELPNVRQFRLDQRPDRSLCLSLVVIEAMSDEEIDTLRRRLQAVLELDVPVEVQFTDTIEPEPSGKYRFVRSEALSA
jgi:phenylacetate-CoA ligase